MSFDIERARRETPGCKHVLHFNNAGASLMPSPVIEGVQQYFNLEIMRGGYEAAAQAAPSIKNFYTAASKLVGCSESEIAYAENATRAWDMAFYSLAFKPGDKILTAVAEYASNYIAFLQVAKKTGAIIEVIANDEYGQLSLKDLEKRIDSRVKLIAITHIPTQGGLINPAEEVGKIAKANSIFYLLDATQSIGQMPINVREIGCDALCATGRKYLRAPRGTGFLYVRKEKLPELVPPFLDLHAADWMDSIDNYQINSDATRFETWETNYGNKIGLGIAIDYALSWGLENIWSRIDALANKLRTMLSAIPGVTLQDLGKNKCGIVTFSIKGLTAQEVQAKLLQQNINVSVSHAKYARIDFMQRGLTSIVRSSLHYYNTQDEIEHFSRAVENVALGKS